jgi:OFA family oxalate/formate antiporter-like MFS transporter
MAATPTPSGISVRSMALPVELSGEAASISRWWRLLGGVLMTLALGTLYAWSVFVTPLEKEFGWKRAQTSTVFTFAAVMFAASLLLAGRLQDRFGPFWISLTGSILITLSFLLFSHTTSLYFLYFFYGVLGGIGNGFGYGTVVPVMAKWFPDKMGLAIGLALAGYGGGSAIFGTVANLVLFPHFGWRTSCVILSGIFFVMTMTGAFLMKNPQTNRQPASRDFVPTITYARHQFTPG